jgi:hypothetical protein
MADDKFTFTLDNGKKQDVEGEFHQIEYNFLRPRAGRKWFGI